MKILRTNVFINNSQLISIKIIMIYGGLNIIINIYPQSQKTGIIV